MFKRSFACAVALAASATVATPANNHGWYVGIEGGWDERRDEIVHRTDIGYGPPPSFYEADTLMTFRNGWAGIGTIGAHIFHNVRLEGELGYRSVGESWSETTAMANVLYDLELVKGLTLSLGAGIGVGLPDTGYDDGNDARFAYQGIVGLSYAMTPGIDLTVTGRLLTLSSGTFSEDYGWMQSTIDVDSFQHATVTIGLRFDL